MKEYINLNKATYDRLADEYFERLVKYDNYYKIVGERICDSIFETDILKNKIKNEIEIQVLELGCGPGAILQALKKYNCINVHAIDFSERMIYFAHKSNEDAKLKVFNVLDISNVDDVFGEHLKGNIDVLIMAAFIHLFPQNDAKEILMKTKDWLAHDGILYLDTTEEKEFVDGEIQVKRVVEAQEIKYLRTRWTQKKFNDFITGCGFEIIHQKKHVANNGKIWMRTLVRNLENENRKKKQ